MVVDLAAPPSAVRSSPLAREQERELEFGLTVIGILVGGLTGYAQVPFGALDGNLPGGVASGILGGLVGLSLGKSLFLSMRAQWFVWAVLAALGVGGYWLGMAVGGPLAAVIGADVGAAAATVFLLFGLHPLAEMAEKAAPGSIPLKVADTETPLDEPPSEA